MVLEGQTKPGLELAAQASRLGLAENSSATDSVVKENIMRMVAQKYMSNTKCGPEQLSMWGPGGASLPGV